MWPYCFPAKYQFVKTIIVLLSKASLKVREGLELFPGNEGVGKTLTWISPRSKLPGSM